MKDKSIFLYVHGDEYSAQDFSSNYNKNKIYKQMKEKNLNHLELEGYIEVDILEFDKIDDKFMDFLRDNLLDYDTSKDKDLFEIE